MSAPVADDLTQLLGRWNRGEPDALAEIIPVVYAELRELARRALRRERRDHTLQPTALVHEAFVRLVPQQAKEWQNRDHFFAVCASLMRQVLVDHARRRRAAKRGSGEIRVTLDEAGGRLPASAPPDVELLALDDVLTELARIDERRARVVEMRYFAGMAIPEIAVVLGRAEWDVKKDWQLAKAWLARRLRAA
jgi:RNA polymerase sigma-70 factor, ECF subfamily